jgi:hypothetical protein
MLTIIDLNELYYRTTRRYIPFEQNVTDIRVTYFRMRYGSIVMRDAEGSGHGRCHDAMRGNKGNSKLM